MAHPSKVKGDGYERELRDIANKFGLDSERARGSDGRALGESEGVDLVFEDLKFGRLRIQAKRKKKLPQWLQIPEGADAVAFREDRGETYIMLTYADFLALL